MPKSTTHAGTPRSPAHVHRSLQTTPLNPTNTLVCPRAPRLRPTRREAPWQHRERVYYPASISASESQHIRRAVAVVVPEDEPLLPRALFVPHTSRGARMVRAALEMDKPREPPVVLEDVDDGMDQF